MALRPDSKTPRRQDDAHRQRPDSTRRATHRPRPYTSRTMQITRTAGPNSTIDLQIEVPTERLERAIDEAVRAPRPPHAGPRVPPGQGAASVLERQLGPGAVLDDAVEHLVQDAYRDALVQEDILPLTNAEVDVVQAEEGKPLIFKATVQVRPEVAARRLPQLQFRARDRADRRRPGRPGHRGAARPERDACRGRGPRSQDGDYAVISFEGTRDGEPFEGGTSERMPLILGQERLIPGFEANLLGMKVGDSTEFDITFPDDYPETALAGQTAHFKVELKELREKVLPELDADFVGTLGDFADVDALRADVRTRLERERARPGTSRVRGPDHRVRRRERDRRAAARSWSTRRSR